jgi:ATP-dependent DNA helicase RecG
MAEFEAGWRRMIYEDLLEFQVGLALRRRAWRKLSEAPRFPTTSKIDARIRRLFPFDLTTGQNQAIRDISTDLDSGWAMHRLLQADVGAGKTVVAIYGMLVAVAAGFQTVMMAPTEILAQQHWRTIERLLQHSRVDRRLLTGQLTAAERRETLQAIRSGTTQLVVGTQAVIQQDVEFARLGLAVIDEQHKFGVLQRAHFSSGSNSTPPHTLVMTATPIPRSLCLTQFGDLDLSVISELPPGRQKVNTSRVGTAAAVLKAWDFVREKVRSGRQAYVVCPRIESADEANLVNEQTGAEAVFRQLGKAELREFRLGLLHGQLPSAEKEAVMDAFRRHEIDVLVCTTVVEVGVDVPNATLMVIYDAERFGLSQLHQLRGRIARGHFAGYCFLFSTATTSDATARLSAMEAHASGFDIAEADFALRGPGDLLGTRQSGALPLRVADLVRDQAILKEARDVAFELVGSGRLDTPEFLPLKVQVLERFGRLLEIAGSG